SPPSAPAGAAVGWSSTLAISTPPFAAGRRGGAEEPATPKATAFLMTSPARRRPPMPYDDEGDHEVGYGKPPRHRQFVKGQPARPAARRQEPEDPTQQGTERARYRHRER